MPNGNGKHDDQLDDALENTFPGSDPVSMTQPQQRQGTPKQHSQTAAQTIKDNVRGTRPDYLWLGGAFVLGCIVGIVARSAPDVFARPGYGARVQRKISNRFPDLELRDKLTQLLARLS